MVFVPHMKRLQAPMACYGVSFALLYIDGVCTAQETPTSLNGLLRGSLRFIIYRWCLYLTGNTYKPQWIVTGTVFITSALRLIPQGVTDFLKTSKKI
jgi:hypothetical protein